MADGEVVKNFLAIHPHFELCRDRHGKEKVRCKLTGHELPPRLSALETYTKGKKYQRLIKDIPNESPDFEEFKDFLVPSEKNRYQVYCQLTKRYINNAPHHIQRHVTGKRFIRALKKYREQQNLQGEKSDEEIWVPSDFESDSEMEGEENGEKKEQKEDEDSGGEFSSEAEEDTYERKDQGIKKRTLKESEKNRSKKKLKVSVGKEGEKDSKQPKKGNKKKTKKL